MTAHDSRLERAVAVIALLATVLIFIADLAIELGVAAGVPYIVSIWLIAQSRRSPWVWFTAGLCSVFTIVGFIASPSGGELWKVLANRGLALMAIWLTAVLCTRNLSLLATIQGETAREGERRLLSIIESAGTGMLVVRRDGTILLANPALERIFGYGRRELLGKPVEVLVPPEVREQHPNWRESFFENPAIREMGANADFSGSKKDGHAIPLEIGLTPVDLTEGPCVVASVIDVSERKRVEEAQRNYSTGLETLNAELQRARDSAQAASQAKSQFLANMSHEIRTPMNAILGLTEVLLGTELDADQHNYLVTVLDSGESLLTVINDILDYSKIEAGKLTIERVQFNIHDVVGDALKSLALRAHRKGLELLCFVEPDIPEEVIGDPSRLRQVILNLVNNAIKFTSEGEIAVRAHIEEHDREPLLRFQVRDTGQGIPAEKLGTIFSAFEQVDSSTTREQGGTGLGLTICSRIVSLLGGQIWAESEVGRGSTFHFTARFGLPESSPGQQERTKHITESLEGLRLLIVDDNSANRMMLDSIVRSKGIQPTLAASADEGHQRLQESFRAGNPIRLVLSDVSMPGEDGFAFVRRIRQDADLEGVEVVFLTSTGNPGDQKRCEELGVAARLMKPVKQSELFQVILRTLGLAPEQVGWQTIEPTLRTARRLRILLAEDSVANQTLALALLQKHNHTVIVANNGQEGLEALATQDFDVVLMDIQMPVLDGLKATTAIREREKGTDQHLPIVAMTAHAMVGDREKYLAAGMDDYISKPVRQDELYRAIDAVCLQRASVAEPEPTQTNPANETATIAEEEPTSSGRINWEKAMRQVGKNKDLLAQVTGLYSAEIREITTALGSECTAKNSKAVATLSHKLKTPLLFYGAEKAYHHALELEGMGGRGELGDADNEYTQLQQEVDGIVLELEAFLAGGTIEDE